ncbi:MAG TPA: NAD-dependent epimerase/dehydratase family protein [Gaiellaceae bacterium]|nr:NAD-dependent epimerase/dehydratase family protein [Gaiellaceae bacterium]
MRGLTRALVVGGAGFYGGWVVEALRGRGVEPLVLDTAARAARDGSPAVETVAGDATEVDLAGLVATRRIDAIFQLAGTGLVPSSLERPLDDLVRNAATTVAVLDAARRAATPPVVAYVSSAAVYGEGVRMPMDEEHPTAPLSPYGISKLAAERYVALYAEMYGLPAFSVRPFSLYGPRQRKLVVYDLLRRARDGESPLVVAAPAEVSRDFVYVEDAAGALVALAESAPARGEAYNIASGRPTTLRELAEEIVASLGLETPVEFTGALRPGDPVRWDGDASRARALGASFDTPLAEGLRRTAAWLAGGAA